MATLPKGRMTSRSNHGLDQDKQGEGDGGCCARTRADQAEAADLTNEATAGGDKARPSEPGKEAAARTHHDGEGNRAGLHQELAFGVSHGGSLKPQAAVLGVAVAQAPEALASSVTWTGCGCRYPTRVRVFDSANSEKNSSNIFNYL